MLNPRLLSTSLSPIATLLRQPKIFTIQRVMFGDRLIEAPHVGDVGGKEPKRGSFQLLVMFAFLPFRSSVDFAFQDQPHSFFFGGGVS